LKAHVGVDAKEGTVHSVVTTAANVADSRVLPELLQGEERKVWGDGGYQGQTEAIKQAAPKAQDMTCKRTRYKNRVNELQRAKNRSKSSVRAKVEHPFRILKRIFGFDKLHYEGWRRTTTGCAPASPSSTSTSTANAWSDSRRAAPKIGH